MNDAVARSQTPFRPGAVLALVIVGTAAFVLILYALATGLDGRDERDGGVHGASNGLAGMAALVALLEAEGHEVTLSRNPAALEDEVLLVLTPPALVDGEEVARIIAERRYVGPTLLILPKWIAAPLPDDPRIEAEDGWVQLVEPLSPEWLGQIEQLEDVSLVTGTTRGWQGLDMKGRLPEPEQVQAAQGEDVRNLYPLITDTEDDILAGWRYDGGYYPVLAEASGERFFDEVPAEADEDAWPLVIVFEPDLVNNYGLADRTRARAALALVAVALKGDDLPIVFDLTLPGLGQSRNLLTLAFAPPFLAATLALLAAALTIGWRAFLRFGAPRAELPGLAFGKTQLAVNGAGIIERVGRFHLLGAPYAELLGERIASRLGAGGRDRSVREAAIARALEARGEDPQTFASANAAARGARTRGDLLRGAEQLSQIERKIGK